LNLYVGKLVQIKTKEELLKTPFISYHKKSNYFNYLNEHQYCFIEAMFSYSKKIIEIKRLVSEVPLQFELKNTPFIWEPWMVKDLLIIMLESLT
jgi:hypothetical protein